MNANDNAPDAAAAPAEAPQPAPKPWYVPDTDLLIAKLATAVFFLAILFFYPFADVYEFDPDEGNRLMIAKLVSEGHSLYSDIWNDQPPLMTYILRIWCGIFGWEVNAARVLTLILASVMAFAGYDAIRTAFSTSETLGGRVAGHVGGLTWMLLLPIVDQFLRLSVSAMVGLPSIAFAVLSVWGFVRWVVSSRQSWLIASGVFMGCSLMIKAFTGFLLPILGLAILICAFFALRKGQPYWKVLPAPALWSVVVIGFCALLLLAIVPISDFDQLYKPHAAGAQVDIGSAENPSLARLASYVEMEQWLFVLAGVGAIGVAVRQKWALLVFAAWCVLGYIGLRNHAPIWYHHGLLITIPAALLSGALVASVIDGAWPFQLRLTSFASLGIGAAGIIFFGLLIAQYQQQPYFTFAQQLEGQSAQHRFYTALVGEIQQLNPDNNVIVTDRQMYALNAGVSIPPDHGLTTSKRVDTGNLTTEEILAEINEYQPNQIVLVRAVLKALGRDIATATISDYQPLVNRPGEALIMIKRALFPEDPASLLTAAAAEVPEAGFAWVLIGDQQRQSGDLVAAIASYERALSAQLDPRSFMQVASFYVQQRAFSQDPAVRNPAKAEPVLQAMLPFMRGRQLGSYYEFAGQVAAAGGNRPAAVERLTKALQIAQQANDTAAMQRINAMLQRLRQ